MKNQKKLFSALLIGTFLVGAGSLSAAASDMDVTDVTTLRACLSDSAEKNCIVKNNITLNDNDLVEGSNHYFTKVTGTKTLELSTFKIERTATTNVATSLVYVGDNAKLTVNATTGGINTGEHTIAPLGLGDNAELIVNGGVYVGSGYGISGNGNRHDSKITVNGGTIQGGQVGIYHPQTGTLTVNGGNIEGATGIEMRSGTLVVNKGNVKATATSFEAKANGNGNSTKGAGIAVVQHTTKNSIDVTVKGGNIQGNTPLYQGNVQNNAESDVAKISLSVEGGVFTVSNGGTKSVSVENIKNYISGGEFSVAPTKDDMASNVHVVNGVVKAYEIQLDFDSAEVDVTMTPAKPVPGDKVKVVVTSKVGEGIVYVNAYENGKIVTVTKNENGEFEFEMPSNDVYVNVRAEKYGVYNYLETEANEQVNVNENYENWHGFSGYFSENAAKTIEKIVTGMVEDVEHKMVDVSGYVEAYEYDFDKNYEDLTDEGKALYDGVKKLLPKGNTIVGFGNVTLYPVEYVDGENWKNIELGNKLSEKITYTLQLPDAYKGKSKYYGLARVVDGKLEVVRGALSQDGMSISFESDQIGDFIFVYGDIANPATYDAGISTYVIAGSISLIGLLALTLVAKKKVFNK